MSFLKSFTQELTNSLTHLTKAINVVPTTVGLTLNKIAETSDKVNTWSKKENNDSSSSFSQTKEAKATLKTASKKAAFSLLTDVSNWAATKAAPKKNINS